MANSKNDDMDRIGNRNTPQGSTTSGSTSQGQGGNFGSESTQGGMTGSRGQGDPINRDREMNRDRNLGQGSSGLDTSGKQGNSEPDRDRNTSGSHSSE